MKREDRRFWERQLWRIKRTLARYAETGEKPVHGNMNATEDAFVMVSGIVAHLREEYPD